MQNKTFIQYLSDYRWLLMIIPAILLTLPSLFGSKVDWGSSFILFSVLYIIGLLFVYQRAKWLALFALSQLPMLVLQIISLVNKNPSFLPNNQRIFVTSFEILLYLFTFIAILIASYAIARKYKLIQKLSLKAFPWMKILIGIGLLLLNAIIAGILSSLIGASGTTDNQNTLDSLEKNIPLIIFFIEVIFAGFFEELVFRVGIFEIMFKKYPKIAFLVAALLFAIMHSPSDFISWWIYGTMSIILTWFYYKYRNFYLNMGIHMAWNIFSLLLGFLLTK